MPAFICGHCVRGQLVSRALHDNIFATSRHVPGLPLDASGLATYNHMPAWLSEGLRRLLIYCDAVSYLPDDILAKVDRASMAVGLETRVPYLDHRVADLAARIPLTMKIEGLRGKHILRQLLYRELPQSLFDRPKAGFAIPVGEWVKGALRPWAEELLEPKQMAAEGWFDATIVQRRWQDHLAGRRDSTPALWAILMFQSWLREEKGALSLAA